MPGPAKNRRRRERFAQGLARGMTEADADLAAGGSGDKGNANRIAHEPSVVARVAELQAAAAAKTEITIERWLAEVAGIAFADIRDVIGFGPKGVTLKDGATLTREQAALIAEVMDTKDGQRVKLHSKLDALDKLARRFGWYAPEKRRLEGGLTISHEEALEQLDRDGAE